MRSRKMGHTTLLAQTNYFVYYYSEMMSYERQTLLATLSRLSDISEVKREMCLKCPYPHKKYNCPSSHLPDNDTWLMKVMLWGLWVQERTSDWHIEGPSFNPLNLQVKNLAIETLECCC